MENWGEGENVVENGISNVDGEALKGLWSKFEVILNFGGDWPHKGRFR